MRLILMRHGLAVDREDWDGPDADRPLTATGQTRTRAVCRSLRRVVRAERILHSPWTRAVETAVIAGQVWNLPLKEVPWLAGDMLGPIDTISRIPAGDLILVGHEPDLGALCGALIGAPPLPLKKAGIAILEGTPHPGGMVLNALIPPRIALDME